MIVRIARVKVGNRQAPQQHTPTPPRNGGVGAFTRTGIVHRRTRAVPRRSLRLVRRAEARCPSRKPLNQFLAPPLADLIFRFPITGRATIEGKRSIPQPTGKFLRSARALRMVSHRNGWLPADVSGASTSL